MPRVPLPHRVLSRRLLAPGRRADVLLQPRPVRRRARALGALALVWGSNLLQAFTAGAALPGFFEATWTAGTPYYKSAWWGWIAPDSSYSVDTGGWIYHQEHGWLYVRPPESGGVWAYEMAGLGWLYFDVGNYRSGSHLYCEALRDHLLYYRSSDRWFYSYAKGRWFLAPRAAVDSDQDEMNDSLERYYFDTLRPRGDEDYDLDGYSNALELVAGTNPLALPSPRFVEAQNPDAEPYLAPFQPTLHQAVPGMRVVATVTRLVPLDAQEAPDPSSRDPELSQLSLPANGTFLLKTRQIDPGGRALSSGVTRSVFRVRPAQESRPLYAGFLQGERVEQAVVVETPERLRQDRPRVALGRGWLMSKPWLDALVRVGSEPDYREQAAEVYILEGDACGVGLDREGLLGSRRRHLLCRGWISTESAAWLQFLVTADPAAGPAAWTLSYDLSRLYFPDQLDKLTCAFASSQGAAQGLGGRSLELGLGRMAGRFLVGFSAALEKYPVLTVPWMLQPSGAAGELYVGRVPEHSLLSEYALARSSAGLSSPVCIGTGWVLRPGLGLQLGRDCIQAQALVPQLKTSRAYYLGFNQANRGLVTDRAVQLDGQAALDLGPGTIRDFHGFRPAPDVLARPIYKADPRTLRFPYTYDPSQRYRDSAPLGLGALYVEGGELRLALQTQESQTRSGHSPAQGLGQAASSPAFVDSDGDGGSDFDEVRQGLNPNARNSDGDLFEDFAVNALGQYLDRSPTTWDEPLADDDGDGASNLLEWGLGSRDWVGDSDGDGHSDFREYLLGSDPLDPGSHASDTGTPTLPGQQTLEIWTSASHNQDIGNDYWRCTLYQMSAPQGRGQPLRTAVLYHPSRLIWALTLNAQHYYQLEVLKPGSCAFVFGREEDCGVRGRYALLSPGAVAGGDELLGDPTLAEPYWVPSVLNGSFLQLGYEQAPVKTVGSQERTCLGLQPAQASLEMDLNQDGRIESGADAPRADLPMRLWLNDDRDELHTVDGRDQEEDDLPIGSDAGKEADAANEQIDSLRDLEDFHRLELKLQGAFLGALASGQHRLGLRWQVAEGEPIIRCYRQETPGMAYLSDAAAAARQQKVGAVRWELGGRSVTPVRPGTPHWLSLSDQRAWLSTLNSGQVCTLPLLVEACSAGRGRLQLGLQVRAGAEFMPLAEIHLELRPITQFYERWSVGDDNAGEPQMQPSTPPWTYPQGAREEPSYILFVHGWNMSPWEKNRFAETTFKRLYWQGYRGRFGVFCWPTSFNFGTLLNDDHMIKSKAAALWSGLTDVTHYDRGEWTAWRSGKPLLALLKELRSRYPGSVYLLAHSMGNVVASEALRLGAVAHEGKLVECYVASQAAVPAHAYTQHWQGLMTPEVIAKGVFDFFDGGWPQTPNLYGDWFREIDRAAPRRVNFHNVNDYALWHDIWEANQYLKPDRADGELQPRDYGYDGSGANNYALLEDKFRYRTDTKSRHGRFSSAGYTTTRLSLNNLAERYQILAFAAESRSRAAGAAEHTLGMSEAVDLKSVWPEDTSGDTRKYSRHKWHSAQFRSNIALQHRYWKMLLGNKGLDVKR